MPVRLVHTAPRICAPPESLRQNRKGMVINMTVRDVARILNATVLSGEDQLDIEVHDACGSDMMSDVLAFVKNQAVLLTGLVNVQVVRTADMMDIVCLVFVRGKVPDEDMLAIARRKDMVVLSTNLRMYRACGLLWEAGLRGGETDAGAEATV